MKNPSARQREEGLQSAQERGRGYSLHKRGGGATVCTTEGEGLGASCE